MIQEWHRNGTGMAQEWYRNDTGMIQEWYRNGTAMVQEWNIYTRSATEHFTASTSTQVINTNN